MTVDVPGGGDLSEPQDEPSRIQVNELGTDRRVGNGFRKGCERQGAGLGEDLCEQIVRTGAG
jgi:hypothetical protein